ncbi:MAG: HAD-IA family hydrolase, partial [Desulfobacula sp.]|nr:HAD-IA family hydrolase [Desulfobacula sp.]
VDLSKVYDCLKNIGYHKFIEYMKVEKGFEKLLNLLKDNGYIIGIATNRTDTMENILEDFNLEKYFDIVMTAAKVKNPKPDPEQLLKILEKFKLNPDELFFIGDSQYDGQAAVRAKVRFAAFKNADMKADFNVDSMDEIARILHPDK